MDNMENISDFNRSYSFSNDLNKTINLELKVSLIKTDLEPYCATNCNNICYFSKINHDKEVQLVNLEKTSCEKSFQKNWIVSLTRNYIEFADKDKCLIPVQLKYWEQEALAICCLDTGSEACVISISTLKSLFPKVKSFYHLLTSNVKLKTASDKNLEILGRALLTCYVGKNQASLNFYVIKEEGVCIIGTPGIEELRLVIDISSAKCYIKSSVNNYGRNPVNKRQLQTEDDYITFENKGIGMLQEVVAIKDKPVQLTTISITNCEANKPANLMLMIVANGLEQNLLYKQITVFECDCFYTNNTLCNYCLYQSNLGENIIKPFIYNGEILMTVTIKYSHSYNVELMPFENYFQGVINFTEPCGEKQVKLISEINTAELACEPFSYIWNGSQWDFSMPGLQQEILIKDKMDSTAFSPFNEVFKSQICKHCIERQRVFCDLFDQHCLNLKKLKTKFHNFTDLPANIIEIKTVQDFNLSSNLVVPIFKENTVFNNWFTTIFGFWKPLVDNFAFTDCKLYQEKVNGYTHYIINGHIATFLETHDILKYIAEDCKKHNWMELVILDLISLKCSKNFIAQVFNGLKLKVHFCSADICIQKIKKNAHVNKIRFGANIADSVEEKNVLEELNILTQDVFYIRKFKDLAIQLNKIEGPLNSLFSKSTHDIGLLTSGYPNYKIIEFKFPIKPGADMVPLPVKNSFISPQLIEPATKMLESLCKAGIITRGYSPFNAVTHFIPKSRKEITLTQWMERGNTKESFVAGIPDLLSPQLLRMVSHFEKLNDICFNNPVVQMSTTQQLKNISAKIKYCTIIDITGAFHSLMLADEAKQLTGFQSGVPGYANAYYNRLPMGASASKNIQDNALLYVLRGIDETLVYSDNLLVLSVTKQIHFENVKKVLFRLRDHGLKCKPSKVSLMSDGILKLYGFYVCLQTGKLSPARDKISALRNRAVPATKRQLKQFMGSLAFFSQVLPLCGKDVAILYTATRGKVFKFGELELKAFENIQTLLSDDTGLFVYRPDHERKYYMVTDSSERHTGYILYQKCNKHHPRILSYNSKTWNDGFAKEIPSMRELLGIIASLQAVQSEVEHNRFGLLLFCDSLPIVLCNIYSRVNAKVARFKIYLNSLIWLEINFAPGKSPVLALADYYSRRSTDEQIFSQKKPSLCEENQCTLIDSKLDKNVIYSAPQSLYVIDSLVNECGKSLLDIKDGSFRINRIDKFEKKCEYYSLTKNRWVLAGNVSNSSCQPSKVVTANEKHKMDALHVQVVTRSTRKVRHQEQYIPKLMGGQTENQTGNKKKLSITCFDEAEKIIDLPNSCLDKLDKGSLQETELIPKYKQVNSDGFDNIPFGQKLIPMQSIEKPLLRLTNVFEEDVPIITDMENCIRTQNFPVQRGAQNYNGENILLSFNKDQIRFDSESFANYFHNFMGIAKYLNFAELKEIQYFDNYWRDIIKKIRIDGYHKLHQKIYFLNDGVLFCKLNYKGLEIFKLIIPDIISHDLVLQSHRMMACVKGLKLFNAIDQTFEVRNLQDICNRVVRQCYNCNLVATKPCGNYRQPLPKDPMLLQRKMECWSLDELYFSSKDSINLQGGYFKVLVAIDLFSHYIIAKPLFDNLTEQDVMTFINEQIIMVFGRPRIITTDNSQNMNSNLIKICCGYLGIEKTTIAPYSSKSLLCELANRLILDSMRAMTSNLYLNPKLAGLLLGPIINMINSLPFKDQKFLCPFALQFAIKPKVDILVFYEDNLSLFTSKMDYFRQLALINDILSKIRLGHINQRKYIQNSQKVNQYYSQIQKGSLVSLKNPEIIVKKLNHKLRPKFKNRFYVVKREGTSVYLSPCSEIYLSDFFRASRLEKEKIVSNYYKADISSCKLLNNLMILNTNKNEKFYRNFIQTNNLPPSFYYNKTNNGDVLLRRIPELQDVNEAKLLEELAETAQIIGRVIKQPLLRGIMRNFSSFDKSSIALKRTNNGPKKKVRFNNQVKMYRLITPQQIYFCLFPKYIPLSDDAKQIVRTLKRELYCNCNYCRLGANLCLIDHCDRCYGRGTRNDADILNKENN